MPATRSSLKSLIPYLPFSTVLRLIELDRLPRSEAKRGGVIFIDIAGFTAMSAALADQGQAGMQALQEIMSRYYNGLLDFVRDYGGVVYQFAGDSILAGMELQSGESDAAGALRAARCAHELHASVAEHAEFEALGGRYKIQTKAGASFGDYNVLQLGQKELWFHPVLVGSAVRGAVNAEVRAVAGQSIVTRQLVESLPADGARLLALDASGANHANDSNDPGDYALIEGVAAATERFRASFSLPTGFDETKLYRRCSYFIQDALLKKITTGHRGFTGEFRNITALFLRFEGFDLSARENSDLRKQLDAFFCFVQNEARTSDGLFLQTDLSDKGGMFMILFGAPNAIENKEAAAARLALRLVACKSAFPELEVVQAGLATGDAYCGDLGAAMRKSYSTLGNCVNLAARLASYGDRSAVHIDESTAGRLPRRFVAQEISGVALKGMGDNLTAYELLSEKELTGLFHLHQDRLIGRRIELDFLSGRMNRALIEKRGGVTAVTGEAGVGKSRLVSAFVQRMLENGVTLVGGHCFSYERRTPFYPWKELLLQLLEIDESEKLADGLEGTLEKISERLRSLEDVSVDWAPALGALIGLRATENAVTRALDPREKNLRLFQIIFELIEAAFRDRPGCLYFEDVHWMDETSFRLIEYIAARIDELPVILLLSLRPDPIINTLQESSAAVEGRLAELSLEHFSDEDADEFVRHRLNLESPNEGLERMILNVAHGNPFFIESIVESLIEQGHLQNANGQSPNGKHEDDAKHVLATEVDQIRLPGSLRDVLLARLDSLDENAKTTLKTASVIGRVFSFDVLTRLLPDTLRADQAEDSLIDLERMDLTRLESPTPLEYIFKHVVIRDVAYESMLLSTREYIHRRLAEHLEEIFQENLRDRADTLAFHYLQGSDATAALRYVYMAGAKARESYANRDAIGYFEQALEILDRPDTTLPERVEAGERSIPGDELRLRILQDLAEVRSRIGGYDEALDGYRQCLELTKDSTELANVHMGMGLIYQERGEPGQAVKEMERAMRLLGVKPPQTKASTILSLLYQFGVRFVYSKFPRLARRIPPKGRKPARLLLRAIRILTKIYVLVDLEKFAWSTVYGVNLAERLRDPAELSQYYGPYGIMLNGMGFFEAADSYFDRGLELARPLRSAPLVEGLLLQLSGTRHLFREDPAKGLDDLDQSIRINRAVGGIWELLTSLGTQGQLLFLLSRFAESREKYDECGELAFELNSSVHLGWKYCKGTFCKYLLSDSTPESIAAAREGLNQAIAISLAAEDLMNQIITCGHLTVVARHANDPEEAARLAAEILRINQDYKVNLPHVKIALVDAAEAALFALERAREHKKNSNGAIKEKDLLATARRACRKARSLGKSFSYMRGPAESAYARYIQLTKGPAKARPIYERALRYLDGSPHQWERGRAFAAAAQAYPPESEERRRYLRSAREIFEACDIRAELTHLPPA
ncbi:MAG: AAA family ATPase [bacterium]|nr:AAA family ATPase [bacterium]